MIKTEKLQLPIYNAPLTDKFILTDWNTANTNLETAYNDILDTKVAMTQENVTLKQEVQVIANNSVASVNVIKTEVETIRDNIIATNPIAELTDARGTFLNLGDRLEDIDGKVTGVVDNVNTTLVAKDLEIDLKLLEQQNTINTAITNQNINVDTKISTAEANLTEISNTLQQNVTATLNKVEQEKGNLALLSTSEKTNLVSAINEINANLGSGITDVNGNRIDIKINSIPTLQGVLLKSGTDGDIVFVSLDEKYAYVRYPSTLKKLSIPDLSLVASTTVVSSSYKSMLVDGDFIYTLEGANLVKRNKSNLGIVSSFIGTGSMIEVCSNDKYIYASNGSIIYKIDKVGFTLITQVSSSSVRQWVCDNNKIYVAYGSNIYIYDCETLELLDTKITTEAKIVAIDDLYVYTITYNSSASITTFTKYNKADFSLVVEKTYSYSTSLDSTSFNYITMILPTEKELIIRASDKVCMFNKEDLSFICRDTNGWLMSVACPFGYSNGILVIASKASGTSGNNLSSYYTKTSIVLAK